VERRRVAGPHRYRKGVTPNRVGRFLDEEFKGGVRVECRPDSVERVGQSGRLFLFECERETSDTLEQDGRRRVGEERVFAVTEFVTWTQYCPANPLLG